MAVPIMEKAAPMRTTQPKTSFPGSDANEGIDAHPALYDNVVGRAVNQIPGIGYFVMALASLPGKLVLGWVVLMGAAFSIIGTAIASLARQ